MFCLGIVSTEGTLLVLKWLTAPKEPPSLHLFHLLLKRGYVCMFIFGTSVRASGPLRKVKSLHEGVLLAVIDMQSVDYSQRLAP